MATCLEQPKVITAPAPATPQQRTGTVATVPAKQAVSLVDAAVSAVAAQAAANQNPFVMVLKEGPKLVAAGKRNGNGEPLQKQLHHPGMEIDTLLNPVNPPTLYIFR